MQHFIVVGANGGIGRALTTHILEHNDEAHVTAILRDVTELGLEHERLSLVPCDHSDASIKQAIADAEKQDRELRAVFLCTGILHTESFGPEKRLEQFNENDFMQVMSVNAALPLRWLQHCLPLIRKSEHVCFAAISARVGSIGDNHLGGWYSYRASKAALNMMLKTAANECKRRAKMLKLLAFHPGTTDTPLSEPFQANVPEGKLFSPEFVAERFYNLSMKLESDGELSFMDWDEKSVEW